MDFLDDQINYIINAGDFQKNVRQSEQSKQNENYEFYIINDIDKLDSLPVKAMKNGGIEYSQTKLWNKTIDEMESEQIKYQEMQLKLNNIEILLERLYSLVSSEITPLKDEINAIHKMYEELLKSKQSERQEYETQKGNESNVRSISLWNKLFKT